MKDCHATRQPLLEPTTNAYNALDIEAIGPIELSHFLVPSSYNSIQFTSSRRDTTRFTARQNKL